MPAQPDFDAVFTEHADFAWRSLARLGVPERDLEDVCQEVFVVVLKRLPSFEQRSSLKTWVYGICRRVAAGHRRKAAHAREIPAQGVIDLASADDDDAVRALAAREGKALVDALLTRLPDEQREAFVLYEIEELTMREVAEALDCPQSTAHSRHRAARASIEAALKRLRAQRRVA